MAKAGGDILWPLHLRRDGQFEFELAVWAFCMEHRRAEQAGRANRRLRLQFIHKVCGSRESPIAGGSSGTLERMAVRFGFLSTSLPPQSG